MLEGVAAPVLMWSYANEWERVRGEATLVQGSVRPEVLVVDGHWKGGAADAYVRAVKLQGEAAGRIGAAAHVAAQQLEIAAGAGLAFYLAIGVILAKFIAAMVTAVTAFGSVAFSWAGLLLAVEEAAVTPALITAAVGALTTLLGLQTNALVNIQGEQLDASVFPNGKWPPARTETYSDATVTDGDAEWSFER